MKNFMSGILAVAAMIGLSTSAFGAAGTFVEPSVTALTTPVTYRIEATTRKAALDTYVAFEVGAVQNTGGNTINNITITYTATVTDTDEKLTLYKPEAYLPASCSWIKDGAGNPVPANAVVITCYTAQLKNLASFPGFTVFYRAPVKVANADNTGPFDQSGTDFVSTTVKVVYAEGTNDQPNSQPQNSVVQWPAVGSSPNNLVELGTRNPTYVNSALPKDGGTLATGDDATPTDSNRFAAKVTVPAVPTITKSSILVNPVTSNDDVSSCNAKGNFFTCYLSTILIKDSIGVELETSPDNPLNFTLRINASEVKANPFRWQAVEVYHDGVLLTQCASNEPNRVTPHCWTKIEQLGNQLSLGDLRRDVQITAKGLTNGLWTAR
jgi:hypothetical protein